MKTIYIVVGYYDNYRGLLEPVNIQAFFSEEKAENFRNKHEAGQLPGDQYRVASTYTITKVNMYDTNE